MPALDDNVREHVVREMRDEVRDLARKRISATEIDQTVNGHRTLTEAEQSLIDLLTYHAVAEVQGHY